MGNSALAALFGLRCILMMLTIGVAYAYYKRGVEFVRGRETEDRLGAAIWLFAIGAAFTNINSAWLMIAMDGEFHGSIGAVFFGLCVITLAHYLALTAWASYRFDIPARHVAVRAGAGLAAVGAVGSMGFYAYLAM